MTLFYEDCKNFPQLAQYIRERSQEEFISQVTLGYVVEASPIIKATIPLAKQYTAKLEEVEKLKEYASYTTTASGEESIMVYDFAIHLMEHLDSYEKAYELFQEEGSKNTFFQMIMFRLLPYTGVHLDKMRTDSFLYFRQELLEEGENGVFVDVGAYLGASALDYVQSYGEKYKKIYLFEPNPVSLERCRERTTPLANVEYSSQPLSAAQGESKLLLKDYYSCLHPEKGETIATSTLDQEVSEPITFLKVNVAGTEKAVLQGAKGHISKDKPNIAVAMGYLVDDLYAIPLFLKECNPDQTFYLRYHGLKDSTVGFVLYAKPTRGASTPTESGSTSSDLDVQLNAAIASLGGTTAPVAPSATSIPSAAVAAFNAKLNAITGSLGGTTAQVSPSAPSTPVSPVVSDLDAQLNAALASLSGTATPTPSTPTSTPVSPVVSDLDAQLNAALASLSGTATPTPSTPTPTATPVSPVVSDLDAQLSAALASLRGTATPTPSTPTATPVSPVVSDLDAQLSAALASLRGTATPSPATGLDGQLQSMKEKLESMSSTLEQVTGYGAELSHGNFNIKSNAGGLTFSKVEAPSAPPAPAAPVVPTLPKGNLGPKEPVVPESRGNTEAMDLIETMTQGVIYLAQTYQTNDPVYADVVEALGLSLDALKRKLNQS